MNWFTPALILAVSILGFVQQKEIEKLQKQIDSLHSAAVLQNKAILELNENMMNNIRAINHNAELSGNINKVITEKIHEIDQRTQGD
jgi:uncharacterized coiled-coil protein SlyX